MQFHAELECRCRLATMIDTHVAGSNTLDGSIVVVQDFGSGKSWEYLDAQRLGLLAQPAHDIGERDHVIVVVLEAVRQYPVRCPKGFGFGQE